MHNFLTGYTEINIFKEAELVSTIVIHILSLKRTFFKKYFLLTGFSYRLETVNEYDLSLYLSAQFEMAWG